MPNVVQNNDIHMTTIYTVVGAQCAVNRCFWICRNVAGTVQDNDLLSVLAGNLGPPWKAAISNDATLRGIAVQKVLPLPKTVPIYDTNQQGIGGSGSPVLPKQVSGIITRRTAFAGRGFRGRMYVPFPSEVDSDGVEGRPTAGYVTRLTAIGTVLSSIQNFTAGGNTADWFPVLWAAPSGTPIDILTGTGRTYWANQRRRGDFGSANPSPI